MPNWTNEPDLRRLENLRVAPFADVRGHLASSRQHDRMRVALTPEARFGIAAADHAFAEHLPMETSRLSRMIPATAHARIPTAHPTVSLAGRFSGQRAREERAEALDARWTAIAQTAAQEARQWIAVGSGIGIRGSQGLDRPLQREIRARAVDDLAKEGLHDRHPIGQQLEERAAPTMRRASLFLSMGPDVEAAVDRGAREQAGPTGDAARIATNMRHTMAAARIGALTPRQIADAATSPAFAALDALEPGGRPMATPPYGRTHASPQAREQAIRAAMSSPERPVPPEWAPRTPSAPAPAMAPASRAAAIAAQVAMQRR